MVAAALVNPQGRGRTHPPGTQFVETVNCDGELIRPGGPGSSTGQRTFDAQGNPVTNGDFEFVDNGQCTVTETQTGGAANVTYECEGTVPPPVTLMGSGARSPAWPDRRRRSPVRRAGRKAIPSR